MKRSISFLLSLVTIYCSGCGITATQSTPKGKIETEVELTSYHSDDKKNAVELSWCYASSYFNNFVTVYFRNRTNERIYIEWENARCNFDKVVFGDDKRITMGNAKQDEAVSAHSSSLTRDVTSRRNILSNYIIPLYDVKKIQSGEDDSVYLMIPVRFADGTIEEYSFRIRLFWQAENAVNVVY
jgi:hypothetical protein